MPFTMDLRSALDRDGYVRIKQALSREEVDTLRDACNRIVAITRGGQWPYLRSLSKQFPPWKTDASDGIWGVQHLLHPNMPDREIYARSYFGDVVVAAVTELLSCTKDDLVMELYNLLVRPDRDFALRWHRDDIGPDVSPAEEQDRLDSPMMHAQWNLALYDDHSLIVVPGSHKRARTDREREADPYEEHMPGQQVVEMAPGDIVFYNNNILHRGVYDSSIERCTLHGSMGVAGADPARARVILQHGIGDWAAGCDFSCLPGEMAALADGMQQRLIEIGSTGPVEYSQKDP